MNFEQYLKQRNELINAAETLIGEGKLEESQAKMDEVKNLDEKWEEIKVANANLEALKDDKQVVNLENKTESVAGGKVVGNIEVNQVKNEDEVYVDAWAKHLMNQDMTQDERNVFAKVNNLSNEFTHTTVNTPTLIPETEIGRASCRERM